MILNVKGKNLFLSDTIFLIFSEFPEGDESLLIEQGKEFAYPFFDFVLGGHLFRETFVELFTDFACTGIAIHHAPDSRAEFIEFDTDEMFLPCRLKNPGTQFIPKTGKEEAEAAVVPGFRSEKRFRMKVQGICTSEYLSPGKKTFFHVFIYN
jgi:hypothetical protein